MWTVTVFVDRMSVQRDASSSVRVAVAPAEDTRTRNSLEHCSLVLHSKAVVAVTVYSLLYKSTHKTVVCE